MIRNCIKTSIRALLKQRGFTAINIVGLTLGLTCSILIFLWIGDEMKFDRVHKDGDRIYKMMFKTKYPDGTYDTWGSAPQPLEEVLETEYPEIEHAVQISRNKDRLLTFNEENIKKTGIFASEDMFLVFDMSFIAGNKNNALKEKNSIVITEELAEIWFGSQWQQHDVLGKSILIENNDLLMITGIVSKPNMYSSIQFDYVIPLELDVAKHPSHHQWDRYSNKMFVKLREGAILNELEKKIEGVVKEHSGYEDDEATYAFMYPIEKQYLYGKFENGTNVGGRIEYIQIFGVVSVFVLVLACINFMNLATARSFKRSREVGIRKVVGAGRGSLIVQFISESILVTFISLLLALMLTMLLLPTFNLMTGKALTIDFGNSMYWMYGIAFLLMTGLLAGFYPAFIISKFKPAKVLKGSFKSNQRTGLLRKSLVVFQFFLSIFMIAGTLIVHYQVDFIMNRNLGIEKEHMLIYNLNQESQAHYQAIKNDLLQLSEIVNVTTCDQSPMNIGRSVTGMEWEGKKEGEIIEFNHMMVSFDFVETLGIDLIEGRDFSTDYISDSNAYLINEAAMEAMGFQHPLNLKLNGFGEQDGKIIGLFKNFHGASVYDPIKPLLVVLDSYPNQLYIRTATSKTREAIEQLQKLDKKYASSYPFEYKFMNEQYDKLFTSEIFMSKLSNFFALLAIVISCLGLIGLASLNIANRVKEIGIRKVMGVSVSGILRLITKEYLRLILLAFVISIPVINYFITDWLSKFEYKIDLHWWLYPISGILVLLVAILSVSWQSFKAAITNPVNSLRDE